MYTVWYRATNGAGLGDHAVVVIDCVGFGFGRDCEFTFMLSGLLWLVDSCGFVSVFEGEGSRIPIDFGFVGVVAGVEV